jgi:hypothetical protein
MKRIDEAIKDKVNIELRSFLKCGCFYSLPMDEIYKMLRKYGITLCEWCCYDGEDSGLVMLNISDNGSYYMHSLGLKSYEPYRITKLMISWYKFDSGQIIVEAKLL